MWRLRKRSTKTLPNSTIVSLNPGRSAEASRQQIAEVALIFGHHTLVHGICTACRTHQSHHVVATLLRFAHHALNVSILIVHSRKRKEHGVHEYGRNVLVVVEHHLLHRLGRMAVGWCVGLVAYRAIDNARRESVEERAHQCGEHLIFIHLHKQQLSPLRIRHAIRPWRRTTAQCSCLSSPRGESVSCTACGTRV